MVNVKRTISTPGKPDQVDHFSIGLNSKGVVGPHVSNKVIYDLKKGRKAVVKIDNGQTYTFEVSGMSVKMKAKK